MKHFLPLIATLFITLSCCADKHTADNLGDQIENLLATFPGDVGVGVAYSDGRELIIGQQGYPLFSVVKFPLALFVCDTLCKQGLSLDEEIQVSADQMMPDTWSPMREQYLDGGVISYRQLLDYALIQSDNNACDILFAQVGGPSMVKKYIDRILEDASAIHNSICYTESQMHENIARCYDNAMNPEAAVEMLEWFINQRDKNIYMQYLWSTMSKCQTGDNRIAKYIKEVVAAIMHKTGTGPITSEGTVMGVNDVACILFPDGSLCQLVVFIKNAKCDIGQCEELIANIARQVVENNIKK